MAFMTVTVDEAKNITEGGTGSGLSGSGIFEGFIVRASVGTSKGGSTEITYTMAKDLDDEKTHKTIYGHRITNNDGSENKIGTQLFKALMVCCGLDEVSEPEPQDLILGKDKKEVTLMVLEDLSGLPIRWKQQVEYGFYNNKVTEKLLIKKFYRAEDGATAKEIADDVEEFVQYDKDVEYGVKDKLNDGVTQDQVDAFKSSRGGKGGSNTNNGPKAPKKPSPFAKK